MSSPPQSIPSVPSTTPKVLIHFVSLLLFVAGPVLAYTDPSGHITSGAAQAAVLIAFILIATVIFVVNIGIEGLHKYGWSMRTLEWVWSQSQLQVDADIQEFKTLWPQAKPAIEALPGAQQDITNLTNKVNDVEAKVKSAAAPTGLTPEQVVTALEQVTGMTFPRAGGVASTGGASTTAATPPAATT